MISHLFFADDLVLFSEATEEQIHVIRDCLDSFSRASGQKVSFSKSHISFSNNVKEDVACMIASIAGIRYTKDMGKYLGVPSIHGRVTNSLFDSLLDRMNNRLEGWRTKFLTLAGRQVLAQSVLSSIPYYAMQTTLLPEGVCEAIDKKIRSFIWGSTDSKRRAHLVNWDQITQPKNRGGLGLRKARDMNHAFLAKLGWLMDKE